MHLNAYIIRDSLTEQATVSVLHSDRLRREITGISFFTEPREVNSKFITIITVDEYLSLGDKPPSGVYLCVGWKDSANVPGDSDAIFLTECKDVGSAYVLIRDLFERFETWERKLYHLVVSDAPLRELGECSLGFFKNPIAMYTASLRNIFGCEQDKDSRFMLFKKQDLENYLPDMDVDELRLDPEFIESVDATSPTIFSEEMWGYRILFYNIRFSGIYVARLMACETERPIQDGDYSLLEFLAGFVKMAMQRQNIIVHEHPVEFDSCVQKLIEHQPVNEDSLSAALSLLDWNVHDRFMCMAVGITVYDRAIHTTMNVCSRLESNMPSSVAIPLDDCILLIADMSAGKISCDDYLSNLSVILREGMLNAGASREFDDFVLTAEYLDQARTATSIGSRNDPMFWCYRYDDYALSDFVQRAIDGVKIDALIPTGLRRLMEYDLAQKRELTRTLRAYLENNCSPTHTARALFMQRATFVYQLKRIREITGFNLEKLDVRLLLLNVFAAIDETGHGAADDHGDTIRS